VKRRQEVYARKYRHRSRQRGAPPPPMSQKKAHSVTRTRATRRRRRPSRDCIVAAAPAPHNAMRHVAAATSPGNAVARSRPKKRQYSVAVTSPSPGSLSVVPVYSHVLIKVQHGRHHHATTRPKRRSRSPASTSPSSVYVTATLASPRSRHHISKR